VPKSERERFGLSRMDKAMLCMDAVVKSLERIGVGVGVGVKVEEMRKAMLEAGMVEYVTDQLGLMAEIQLVGAGLAMSSE
jgi:hypothetical protein